MKHIDGWVMNIMNLYQGRANSTMQHRRNDPTPFVNAERFEPVKIYKHPIFGLVPAYIRPIFKKKKSNHDHKTSNKHLIPVNPYHFNMYNQRSNGTLHGYGQSLYVPSGIMKK